MFLFRGSIESITGTGLIPFGLFSLMGRWINRLGQGHNGSAFFNIFILSEPLFPLKIHSENAKLSGESPHLPFRKGGQGGISGCPLARFWKIVAVMSTFPCFPFQFRPGGTGPPGQGTPLPLRPTFIRSGQPPVTDGLPGRTQFSSCSFF